MIGYQDKINQILRGAETIKNTKDNNMNCPYDYDNPEFRLEWFEKKLEEKEEFIDRAFDEWAYDDTKIEEMLEPIIGKEFIEGDSYCVPGTVACVEELVKKYDELKLERDALWVKTQEDEREINDLRDVNKQLRQWKEEALKVMSQWNEVSDYINSNAEVEDLGRFVPQICLKYLKERDEMKKVEEQRDDAIRLATLFQTLYLRLGKAEDEHYNTLMVQGAAKSLAELKGLKFFGEEEA